MSKVNESDVTPKCTISFEIAMKKGNKSRRQVERNGLGLDSNRHNLTMTQYEMRPSKKEEEGDGVN